MICIYIYISYHMTSCTLRATRAVRQHAKGSGRASSSHYFRLFSKHDRVSNDSVSESCNPIAFGKEPKVTRRAFLCV